MAYVLFGKSGFFYSPAETQYLQLYSLRGVKKSSSSLCVLMPVAFQFLAHKRW
jgi:hypothetical protein